MAWKPVPAKNLVTARKLAGDGWVDIEMKDLQPGDVFRAVFRGEVIHPETHEPDDEAVALVTDHPIKNVDNQIGSLLGAVGWGVPIHVFESMDELKRKGLS